MSMTGESQNTQVAGETTPPSTGGQEPLASVVVCVYNRPQQVISCLPDAATKWGKLREILEMTIYIKRQYFANQLDLGDRLRR